MVTEVIEGTSYNYRGVDVKNTARQSETISVNGNPNEMFGIKTAKSFRNYLQGRITFFSKRDKQIEMMLRTVLGVYDKFHPVMKATVEIEGWKGTDSLEITKFDNYFETVQHRKNEEGIKTIKHKISFKELRYVYLACKRLGIGDKAQTRDIAQEYCKSKELFVYEGRRLFDEQGYSWNYFFGCRSLYTPFNLCLKILEFYKYIAYYKDGRVERIAETFEFQEEFE